MSKPIVKCPTCEKLKEYDSTNPFRPFCSEQCKLIDLGAWANEEYSIAESSSASDFSSGVLEEQIDSDEPMAQNPPTMH